MRWPTSPCDRVFFWNETQPNRMGHCGLGVWQNTRSGLKFPALPLTFFSTLQQCVHCGIDCKKQQLQSPIVFDLKQRRQRLLKGSTTAVSQKLGYQGQGFLFQFCVGELRSSIYKIFTRESQQNWDSLKCIPNSKLLLIDTSLNSHTSSILTVKTKDGQ